ncbi:MAG TPA: hypothetical protein VJI68_03100, partial [Candidatus Nanoarchaeia archaeon]|nr:hypothetical protein [Candidatus Nanoarchaeia archaeon]
AKLSWGVFLLLLFLILFILGLMFPGFFYPILDYFLQVPIFRLLLYILGVLAIFAFFSWLLKGRSSSKDSDGSTRGSDDSKRTKADDDDGKPGILRRFGSGLWNGIKWPFKNVLWPATKWGAKKAAKVATLGRFGNEFLTVEIQILPGNPKKIWNTYGYPMGEEIMLRAVIERKKENDVFKRTANENFHCKWEINGMEQSNHSVAINYKINPSVKPGRPSWFSKNHGQVDYVLPVKLTVTDLNNAGLKVSGETEIPLDTSVPRLIILSPVKSEKTIYAERGDSLFFKWQFDATKSAPPNVTGAGWFIIPGTPNISNFDATTIGRSKILAQQGNNFRIKVGNPPLNEVIEGRDYTIICVAMERQGIYINEYTGKPIFDHIYLKVEKSDKKPSPIGGDEDDEEEQEEAEKDRNKKKKPVDQDDDQIDFDMDDETKKDKKKKPVDEDTEEDEEKPIIKKGDKPKSTKDQEEEEDVNDAEVFIYDSERKPKLNTSKDDTFDEAIIGETYLLTHTFNRAKSLGYNIEWSKENFKPSDRFEQVEQNGVERAIIIINEVGKQPQKVTCLFKKQGKKGVQVIKKKITITIKAKVRKRLEIVSPIKREESNKKAYEKNQGSTFNASVSLTDRNSNPQIKEIVWTMSIYNLVEQYKNQQGILVDKLRDSSIITSSENEEVEIPLENTPPGIWYIIAFALDEEGDMVPNEQDYIRILVKSKGTAGDFNKRKPKDEDEQEGEKETEDEEKKVDLGFSLTIMKLNKGKKKWEIIPKYSKINKTLDDPILVQKSEIFNLFYSLSREAEKSHRVKWREKIKNGDYAAIQKNNSFTLEPKTEGEKRVDCILFDEDDKEADKISIRFLVEKESQEEIDKRKDAETVNNLQFVFLANGKSEHNLKATNYKLDGGTNEPVKLDARIDYEVFANLLNRKDLKGEGYNIEWDIAIGGAKFRDETNVKIDLKKAGAPTSGNLQIFLKKEENLIETFSIWLEFENRSSSSPGARPPTPKTGEGPATVQGELVQPAGNDTQVAMAARRNLKVKIRKL